MQSAVVAMIDSVRPSDRPTVRHSPVSRYLQVSIAVFFRALSKYFFRAKMAQPPRKQMAVRLCTQTWGHDLRLPIGLVPHVIWLGLP